MSRLTPVRADWIVFPITSRLTPPPSNQMPRPQAAVLNWPEEEPEIRLSVTRISPVALGEAEIARSSLVPPATVDQKIEFVTS
jgi:hypothetical protein